jgi:hypothetical protein
MGKKEAKHHSESITFRLDGFILSNNLRYLERFQLLSLDNLGTGLYP